MIPAADDGALWNELAAAMARGIFVVALDTKPPNKVFQRIGSQPPRFVSSDYARTGVLVGSLLTEWLSADPHRRCMLWLGPQGSWPGEERSRNILLQLAYQDLLNRTHLYPVLAWAPDEQRCADAVALIDAADGEVAVYCADDENAEALANRLHAGTRSRTYIIGCNGTPNEQGRVDVFDSGAVDVTVDILAEQQGDRAAHLLVNERNGVLHPSNRPDLVLPRLLYAADRDEAHPYSSARSR